MKDIYLKKRKLRGRIKHLRRVSWLPLFMCVFATAALVAAAVFVAPHIFRWPVKVTLNGTQVQVPYGSSIGRAAANNMERDQLYGDIIAVDGSVFKQYGGEAPSFKINGQEYAPDTPIHTTKDITVRRGADIDEPIAEEVFDIEPELIYRGYGPFKRVLNSGQVGVYARIFGELSEIEIDVEERVAPQSVEVQFSAFERNSRFVALTFDDGPHPVHTPALLELLDREDVVATFFVTGSEVAKHPNIARQIVEAGHQIANHSYGHQDYRYLSYEEKREDFERSQDIIETATGVRPNWARPPYGLMNTNTFALYGAEDIKIAHWTVDPADWRKPGARTIRERVVNQVKPGSVVLLHDGGGDREQTVRATRRIIRDLRKEGFRFLTVEQLYERSNR